MHLDIDRILRETFVARVEHHPSLDSTNNRAVECATQADAAMPVLIMADHQTAGRGRGSNRWWDRSRFAVRSSLAVDAQTVGADRGPAPLTSLAVGLAVVDTIAPRYCPNIPPACIGRTMSWPTDEKSRAFSWRPWPIDAT